MPAAHPYPFTDQLAHALWLLPRAAPGRAAVTRRALPYVLLAQHLVDDGTVLLRVPAGQIESRLLDGTVLAYHAQLSDGWQEEAPGIQLIGPVSTVRPTEAERRSFHAPARAEGGAPPPPQAHPGPEPRGPAPVPSPQGARAPQDPPGTVYARLVPRLAAVRQR